MCLILRNTVNNVENNMSHIVLSAFKSRLKTSISFSYFLQGCYVYLKSFLVCLFKENKSSLQKSST